MNKEIILVEEDIKRLDVFLSDNLDITRSQIKKFIDEGYIKANNLTVKSGKSLKKGDFIEIQLPDYSPDIMPQNIPLDIVYEDDDLAVINKPQGMIVHPATGIYKDTLVNALLYHFNRLSVVGGAVRPGIVHRLDKDTSGLMLVAKNDFAHDNLSKQIAAKTAKRAYKALLEGVIQEDGGEININLIRDPKDRKRFTTAKTGGKTALTFYNVIERYERRTLTEFVLKTGRTHQIRVHAKYIGHPVVGDKTYGYKNQEYDLKGQLLHSYLIEFKHPASGALMSFTIPLPDYFQSVLEKQFTLKR